MAAGATGGGLGACVGTGVIGSGGTGSATVSTIRAWRVGFRLIWRRLHMQVSTIGSRLSA